MSLTHGIPLLAKILYSGFMALLVPIYWYHYGPTNFLYFCDVALFLTLVGMWWESSLLLSTAAVGILVSQMVWVADFIGCSIGAPITGMTKYMFHEHKPLYLRALSLFHGWLSFLLLWLISRVGYDRRAFWSWTVTAWVLLLIGFFLLPAPPAPPDNPNLPVNVNYVFGLSNDKPQERVHPLLWLLFQIVALPICIYWPTHWVLKRWTGRREGSWGEEEKRR